MLESDMNKNIDKTEENKEGKERLTVKGLMYTKGSNDECYTPDYGVEPILEYIPKDAIVWCPFDEPSSEFVKQISKQNTVVHSHINEGKDFFEYEPDEWDVIVSNPPFTNKRKFFERALSFGKPFALIMTNTWLNDSAPKQLFKEKDLQLLMFDKRMKFVSQSRSLTATTTSLGIFPRTLNI